MYNGRKRDGFFAPFEHMARFSSRKSDNVLFDECSPCLSRACLGKVYNTCVKDRGIVFAHLTACACRPLRATGRCRRNAPPSCSRCARTPRSTRRSCLGMATRARGYERRHAARRSGGSQPETRNACLFVSSQLFFSISRTKNTAPKTHPVQRKRAQLDASRVAQHAVTAACERNASLFECFPYVRPEPVK